MKKALTLAVLVVSAGLFAACSCFSPCAPCCPEPVYRSPCCPAPSGDITGPWTGGGGGGGGGGAACGGPAACGGG